MGSEGLRNFICRGGDEFWEMGGLGQSLRSHNVTPTTEVAD
jgi:hypothetical protein